MCWIPNPATTSWRLVAILEIGRGRGVAAGLICQRLESGKLLAIDRSGTAVAAARARNAAHVEAGKARFEAVSLADLDPVAAGRFDKALAVNVNLFWTRPARVELDLVAGCCGRAGTCTWSTSCPRGDPPPVSAPRSTEACPPPVTVTARYPRPPHPPPCTR